MKNSVSQCLLVIGVGNEFRSDDAVGVVVASQLLAMQIDATVLSQSGDAATLMESWKDADTVVIVDATHSGKEPGTVQVFEADDADIEKRSGTVSSHGFGVWEAIELSRALGCLPKRLVIYGVEGRKFGFGTHLSPQVEKAVDTIVELVMKDAICTNLALRRT